MNADSSGYVLLVGDGDFSFTLSLMKNSVLKPSHVMTSNLETPTTIQQHKLASDNMAALTSIGVKVLLETDARELHSHPILSQVRFQRVIFNFPLEDRHQIKKNRALLADFFLSCSQILDDDGQVMVTLCKGQGGTPADRPMRSWHDSWQVVAMATNGGFILSQILPFDSSDYPEYHSVGFRFQDKSFNTSGALTHVFEKAEVVSVGDSFSARATVESNGSLYSCPWYIAEKWKSSLFHTLLSRNLMTEPTNPVCLLKERLKSTLAHCLRAKILMDEDGETGTVIPGHRCKVTLHRQQIASGAGKLNLMNVGLDEGSVSLTTQQTLESIKDKKNQANLNAIMKQKQDTSLVHGVDQQGKACGYAGAAKQLGDSSDSQLNNMSVSKFVPENSESVYSLIKNYSSTSVGTVENSEGDLAERAIHQHCSGDVLKEGLVKQNETKKAGLSKNGVADHCHNFEEGDDSRLCDNSERVFHCRTSLLENLTDLVSLHFSDESKAASLIENNSKLLCGQCFLPSPITPDTLPVKHEMMAVIRVAEETANGISSASAKKQILESSDGVSMYGRHAHCVSEAGAAPTNIEISCDEETNLTATVNNFDSAYASVISCLQKSELFPNITLCVKDFDSQINIAIEGWDHCCDIKTICQEVGHGAEEDRFLSLSVIGILLKAVKGSDQYCVCILNLDTIACNICNISDPRLLWSQSKRFGQQFEDSIFPKLFTAFSLYPMKFVHDLSFWEKEDEEFDTNEMFDTIRYIAGDLVVSVTLVDIYKDPSTGRKSRCYRIHFLSYDQAFPYLVSWKLQSLIRLEVARRLGVTLR